jgi:DHA2 family multidrug resistance protein
MPPQAASPTAPTTIPQTAAERWLILGTVTLGTFVGIMDVNIVGVAMPQMLGTFGVTLDALTWVAVSYIIASVVTMSMAAWFSALLGRKPYYVLSFVGFTVASVLCGMARSLEVMILARVLQGLAGGGLVPVAQSTILATFPEQERGTAMGVYITGVLAAAATGPILGGWLTDTYGWPWVFYVNLPVGAIGIGLALVVLHDPPSMQRTLKRIDVLGIGLLVVGLTALQLVLQRGARDNWFESSFIVRTALVAVVTLALLIWWELRVDEPVVNFRILRNRPFMAGVTLAFLFGMPFFAGPFLLPLFLQKLRGYAVLDAGLMLLPQALTVVVLAPLAGRLYTRLDSRLLIGGGMALIMLGYISMSRFNLTVSGWHMLPGLLLTGAGMAIMLTVLTTAAMRTMPTPFLPMASSLYNLIRRVGGNIGYAFIATEVTHRTALHRARLIEHVHLYDASTVQNLDGLMGRLMGRGASETVAQDSALQLLDSTVRRQASMLAFNDVFWLMAMLFVLGVPFLLLLGSRGRRTPSVPGQPVPQRP